MFKEKVKSVISGVLNTAKTMPVTIAFVYLAALIAAVFVTEDMDFTYDVIGYIIMGLGLAASGAFMAETGFSAKNPLRYVTIAIAALLSGFFSWVLYIDPFEFSSDYKIYYFVPIILAYAGITLVFAVRNCYRNSKEQLNTYIAGVFINLLFTGIVIGILTSGAMMLVLIFNLLIVEVERLYFIVFILLYGLIAIPAYLIALKNVKEQKTRFPKILISYIMCPIVVAAYAIIYVYMVKLLITWSIPSNQIFAILTGIFVAGAPVFLMTEAVNDAPVYRIGIRILYFLYLPFVLLQCYSVGVRILQYGITPSRYFGIVIIIIELIWLLLAILKPEKRSLIFPVLAALFLITLVLPGVNFNKVSVASQNKIVNDYRENATARSAARAYGAVQYLTDVPPEIHTTISDMTAQEFADFKEELIARKDNGGQELEIYDKNVWCDFYPFAESVLPVDISEYSYMLSVTGYQSLDEDMTMLKTVTLTGWNGDEVCTVDLSSIVTDYCASLREKGLIQEASYSCSGEEYQAPDEWRTVEIDENRVLYIRTMNLDGYRIDDTITLNYVSVTGFVMLR